MVTVLDIPFLRFLQAQHPLNNLYGTLDYFDVTLVRWLMPSTQDKYGLGLPSVRVPRASVVEMFTALCSSMRNLRNFGGPL